MVHDAAPRGPIRVLLVDDHPMVRTGLRIALGEDPRLRLVGAAGTGCDAIRLAQELAPDVVVLDVDLPDLGSLEVLRAIARRAPGTRVLIAAVFADEVHALAFLAAGAAGYLPKHCLPDELQTGVVRVHAGERVVYPPLIGPLIAQATGRSAPPAPDGPAEREQELLRLLAEEATKEEIDAALGLGPRPVADHRARILDKPGSAPGTPGASSSPEGLRTSWAPSTS